MTLRCLRTQIFFRRRSRGENFFATKGLGRLLFVLTLLVLLSSCNLKSPQQQFKEELKTITSWAASLQMMGEAWDTGRVPAQYMTKALENAGQELQTEAESLSKIQYAETAKASALQSTQNLMDAAQGMRQAVKGNDHNGAQQQLERIKGETDALRKVLAEESAP